MRPAFSLIARLPLLAALVLACAGLAVPEARAQSPFAAVVYVNDSPITNYEITQKMRFLEFIGAAGQNPRERAIERLIEERLQLQEGRRLGGRLTPDQINDGIAELAARAELTADEMISRMAAAGIDRETLVEFIRAGVLWREVVRQAYGSTITITESQIDHAISVEGVQPSVEVLISEIFLASDPEYAEAVQRIIPLIQQMRSETDFSNAARQVSLAPSGPSGGRVDRWINVAGIPEPVGPALATAAVGTVIGPLDMPGAYAFFQLRARRDTRSVPPEAIELDYRRAVLPGGRSEENLARVEAIRASADSCADFAGVVLRSVPGLPDSAVEERVSSLPNTPAGERTELERMNPLQISANMVEGGGLVVLMLCARRVATEDMPSREEVRMALINRALEGQASVYLQRLRAEAEIRRR